jgi:hypothetical protein
MKRKTSQVPQRIPSSHAEQFEAVNAQEFITAQRNYLADAFAVFRLSEC